MLRLKPFAVVLSDFKSASLDQVSVKIDHSLTLTPMSRKEGQDTTEKTSFPNIERQNTTCSDSSNNTRLSPAFTNTTHDSAAQCLPRPSVSSAANDAEEDITLRQGLQRYPKAIMWSILFSLTLVMEGYSTILVPNLFSPGPFRRQFGTLQRDGDYEISALWQNALVNGALAGQIILRLVGWLEKLDIVRRLCLD